MNGSQDPRASYPQPPQPPPPGSSTYDPGLGEVPASWRKNVYGHGEDPRRKSPLLAMVLSAMPGLGQVYVGYYNQGFVNMVVCGGTIFLISVSDNHHTLNALLPFLGFFLAFYWLYNMLDAYRRAAFYNQALAGLGPVDFPEDMKLPKTHGSLAGGVALIGVGLLLFANTALGMSLDWLEQWWPMALVLLGAWLVYRNVSEKRATPAPRAQAPEPIERS
jgi:hypothetical protein